MSIKRILKSILRLLFRARCRHKYEVWKRTKIDYYWDSIDVFPCGHKVVTELRCIHCGNVKIVKYKE